MSPFAARLPTVSRVSITLFKRRRAAEPEGPTERPDVRKYRYLLRTADLDALEVLHREALAGLDPLIRGHILRTAQERLLSGGDLTVDDVAGLARLVSVGERRTPGILISALNEAALERLAHFVVGRPTAAAPLAGYDAWDGAEPAVREEPTAQAPMSAPAASPLASSPPAAAPMAPQIASQGI